MSRRGVAAAWCLLALLAAMVLPGLHGLTGHAEGAGAGSSAGFAGSHGSGCCKHHPPHHPHSHHPPTSLSLAQQTTGSPEHPGEAPAPAPENEEDRECPVCQVIRAIASGGVSVDRAVVAATGESAAARCVGAGEAFVSRGLPPARTLRGPPRA